MEALTGRLVSASICCTAAAPAAAPATSNGNPANGNEGVSMARTFRPAAAALGNGALRMQQQEGRKRHALAKSGLVAVASLEEASTFVEEPTMLGSVEKDTGGQNFTLKDVELVSPQDWHVATVSKVSDVAPGVRCITVIAECSREFVALEKAYRKPGQLVQVKAGKKVEVVPPSSAPVSDEVNFPVLYKIRGDIPAGTTKLAAYSISAKAPVDLHVTEAYAPELFNAKEGSEFELGPFGTTGLDLRPIMFLARFPSILLFGQGEGIAVCRAILEAKDGDAGTLNLGLRQDVRLFYSASSPSDLAYKNLFSKWEERKAVKVRTVVDSAGGEEWNGYEGSFSLLWNEDDIEYDPLTTGVIVAVESSKREEVKSVLAEAGIPEKQIIYWDV